MSDTADATFESILEDLYDTNSTTLPQSTQDYLDQVLSPPPIVTPMDTIQYFLDNLESLLVAGPDGRSMPMDFDDFLSWADTPAAPQPDAEKDLNAATIGLNHPCS
ncbi:hypothetical protein CDAR_12761 [Caerostris darwini]|uniref:Uncharacterized protein n=1 Tax=Caerostris darwini TaxID=1538125 RepID=A0AAV4N8Z4_9ARAC|nr:hypothetical protein CDAR_12761 [Caerostris darwini]